MRSPAEDTAEIQLLKARYCAAIDRLPDDPDSLARDAGNLFVTDVSADYGAGLLEGVDALTDFLAGAVAANSTWMVHMIHSPLIEIAGNEASGAWTMLARMKRRDGRIDEVLGRYRDRFVRTPAGWRLAAISFARVM